jgi:hypothetical protein
MWKITNTSHDRSKIHQHRTAGRFDAEPWIDGARLRVGASMEVTDEHYESLLEFLAPLVRDGILEAEKIGLESAPEPSGKKEEEETAETDKDEGKSASEEDQGEKEEEGPTEDSAAPPVAPAQEQVAPPTSNTEPQVQAPPAPPEVKRGPGRPKKLF